MKICALASLCLALMVHMGTLSSVASAQLENVAENLPPQFATAFDFRLVKEELDRAIPQDVLGKFLRRANVSRKMTKKGDDSERGKSKRKAKKAKKKGKKKKGPKSETCNPEHVILSQYQQWMDETGYWVGDYDFFNSKAEHFTSAGWPYSYKKYRGFITGNVEGNKYRQRNVFVYPPVLPEECSGYDDAVKDKFDGKCGINGNTKVFFADQEVVTCSTNPTEQGDIEGIYQDLFYTTTELIGKETDNAVLYQVILPAGTFPEDFLFPGSPAIPTIDCVLQSQLTTITKSVDQKQVFRTRTAQSFECFNEAKFGQPTTVSYYREQKVEEESEFYSKLQAALDDFAVTEGDTCAWQNDAGGNAVPTDYTPGFDGCKTHLEQSFEEL